MPCSIVVIDGGYNPGGGGVFTCTLYTRELNDSHVGCMLAMAPCSAYVINRGRTWKIINNW